MAGNQVPRVLDLRIPLDHGLSEIAKEAGNEDEGG
jgi:hypothetical protein